MPLASGKEGASLMKKNDGADQGFGQDGPFVRAGAAIGAGDYAGSGISFILAGVACGVLQQLWFNWERAFGIAYGRRVAGFGLTYFPVLVLCALLGNWLPADVPAAWALFVALYLLILFVLTFVITKLLRRRGVEYQRDLAAYRERQAKGE